MDVESGTGGPQLRPGTPEIPTIVRNAQENGAGRRTCGCDEGLRLKWLGCPPGDRFCCELSGCTVLCPPVAFRCTLTTTPDDEQGLMSPFDHTLVRASGGASIVVLKELSAVAAIVALVCLALNIFFSALILLSICMKFEARAGEGLTCTRRKWSTTFQLYYMSWSRVLKLVSSVISIVYCWLALAGQTSSIPDLVLADFALSMVSALESAGPTFGIGCEKRVVPSRLLGQN
jgi:hypothetical protein